MEKKLSKLFKSVDGQKNLPKWFKTAALLLDNISIGSLIIELPDKRQFLFSSANPGPEGVLIRLYGWCWYWGPADSPEPSAGSPTTVDGFPLEVGKKVPL